MSIFAAFGDGIRRVNAAPAILAGVALVTLVLALPLGLTLRGLLSAHLGSSLAAETAATGVNQDWWEEFKAQASGIGSTFDQTIIGFAAVLDNVSAVLDARVRSPILAGVSAVYLVLWAFLAGGVLDRYARGRPTRSHGFFGASGVFFFRFLRLAVVMGLVYYLLFAYVHHWLFDRLYEYVTHDLAVERTALAWRFALYAVFGALLVVTTMVFDYAKIRAVVEDRRSMIGAFSAAVRFVRRHPVSTLALYLMNGLCFVLVVALYWLIAPGAGTTGLSMWAAFAIGQLYLLARIWVKLLFLASQTAFFQRALAHASYTAAPVPVWPESPAAEAIGNLK
jgi:hypothetical protein